MRITAGTVAITVSLGAGADFRSRDFSGTGLTSFDAAVGAQIDSQLTEDTPPGTSTSGIGLLKSVTGSIECGGQQPGTSTLVLTGTTPDGTINGPLDPVRVGCNSSTQFGLSADTIGIGTLGTTPVTANVDARANGFSVFLNGAANQYFFTSTDPATATVTQTGAQISGDAATNPAAGAAPFTIHVTGTVVCGSSTSGP